MKMIVMRGCPGSGKTTKAKALCQEFVNKHPNAVTFICSADNYFIDPISGEYKFEAKKIALAHACCRGNAQAALDLGVDLLIVDNTATCKWEYAPYERMAEQYGYEFEACVVGKLDEQSLKEYANRCVHGVPLESIKKMAKRFEQ